MRIFKWNIDREKGHFSCKINKAVRIDHISYVTLSGEKVDMPAASVRKMPRLETKFGRVVKTTDLK